MPKRLVFARDVPEELKIYFPEIPDGTVNQQNISILCKNLSLQEVPSVVFLEIATFSQIY